MKIQKKLITFVAMVAMLLSMVPTFNVQAATINDISIISDTDVSAKQAAKWAKSKGASDEFIDLAELYFEYAEDCGEVNPGIAYVQAAKETGYGRFGGVLDESYHNPCGLKTSVGGGDSDVNAHQKFNSWDEGVQAHLDHLALYAGAKGYPKSDTYDPRHFATLKGKAKTVNSLSANWAPSATYGEEINKLYRDLLKYADVSIGDEEIEDDYDDEENNSSNQSSDSPYPSKPENIPEGLNASEVIQLTKTAETEDTSPNDESTIGWKHEDGVWVYYKSDETKAIGWLKSNNNWYHFKNDGAMLSGWLNDYGKWYYFNESGVMAKSWQKIDNKWYYFKSSGEMSVGTIYDGDKLYYFDGSGAMVEDSGWIEINGKWYFFESGGALKTGWFKNNDMWYYLQGDGTMATGYKVIDSKTYAFDDGGKMLTGWKNVNNVWYYFNPGGDMATGWITVDGTNYYLYNTGAMAKGWIELNGTWYYMANNGAMTTGWVEFNGESYYLDKTTGRLVTNATIDGVKLGSDGKKVTSSSNNDKPAATQGKEDSSSSNNDSSSDNNSTIIYDKPTTGKKVIVVDAGHNYGGDDGAYATHNGITYAERDLNMQVALKLQSELQARGYTVIMTREENDRSTTPELQSLINRVNIANNINADLFVSIHHNTAASAAMGVETYYSSAAQDTNFGGGYSAERVAKSKDLAAAVSSNIASAVGTNNRGARDSKFKVVKNTKMPAILIETGFITTPQEAKRCADSNSQSKVAKAIADAISVRY
ncbi:MAG: cell wall hydrolase [Clostridium butyricum]|nr:cell wall hydrolase [Clostridium butyricum]